MRIYLEVYLPFRGERIWRGDQEVPDGITPDALLDHLELDRNLGLTVIVDGRWIPPDQPITGHEVAVLRQSEGGEG